MLGKKALEHYLVKLKCVPIELLCQHVPLLQDGFVIVCVLRDGRRLRVSEHLPHVAFKTSYYLCNLWFTPKPNAVMGGNVTQGES